MRKRHGVHKSHQHDFCTQVIFLALNTSHVFFAAKETYHMCSLLPQKLITCVLCCRRNSSHVFFAAAEANYMCALLPQKLITRVLRCYINLSHVFFAATETCHDKFLQISFCSMKSFCSSTFSCSADYMCSLLPQKWSRRSWTSPRVSTCEGSICHQTVSISPSENRVHPS